MCRFVVYRSTKPVLLRDIAIELENSIVNQAEQAGFTFEDRTTWSEEKQHLFAQRNHAVNKDGYGIGWYNHNQHNQGNSEDDSVPTKNGYPQLFKSTVPASEDPEVREVCDNVSAPTVFFHVRASTAGGISINNCHPFQFGKFLFMHNGGIAGIEEIRYTLLALLSEKLHDQIKGETDTEIAAALFMEMLRKRCAEANIDEHNVDIVPAEIMATALQDTICTITRVQQESNLPNISSSMNFAATDGFSFVASRFRSNVNEDPPSLYVSLWSEFEGARRNSPEDEELKTIRTQFTNLNVDRTALVASEPLNLQRKHWVEVPPQSMVIVDGKSSVVPNITFLQVEGFTTTLEQREKIHKTFLIPNVLSEKLFESCVITTPTPTSTRKKQFKDLQSKNRIDDFSPLIKTIRNSIIGDNEVLTGPFGPRRLCYADFTASGRSLSFIEEFLSKEVMTMYANTHTESSGTGKQTNLFREDARRLVAQSVNASEEDAVIFVGSGSTGAVNKMVEVLNLRIPNDLDKTYKLRKQIPESQLPVVFIGPYEHHSNDLIWRESICTVVEIMETDEGNISLTDLEANLIKFKERPLKIGSFSAASNVTGLKTDTESIAILLHKYGALSFWDYAAAAPYVDMNMNPNIDGPDANLVYKDAIYISPHKFIGGPGTPGVLVAKKKLFKNTVPSIPGGGTVMFVSGSNQLYHKEPEVREEAGTPAILESIRCGLVFQLKDAVGAHIIEQCEAIHLMKAFDIWKKSENLVILGPNDAGSRVSIVSLVITFQKRFLHYNFVVALLNDLFGIQARGGCSCAGPYGLKLFNIKNEKINIFMECVANGAEYLKPGWFRVNFNYFYSERLTTFIAKAVEFIAEHGWKFVPLYEFIPEKNLWVHKHASKFTHKPRSLTEIDYTTGKLEFDSDHLIDDESAVESYLEEAQLILDHTVQTLVNESPDIAGYEKMIQKYFTKYENLRAFVLPYEAHKMLIGEQLQLTKILGPVVLVPRNYEEAVTEEYVVNPKERLRRNIFDTTVYNGFTPRTPTTVHVKHSLGEGFDVSQLDHVFNNVTEKKRIITTLKQKMTGGTSDKRKELFKLYDKLKKEYFPDIADITPSELITRKLTSNESIVLVDVRKASEISISSIPGSIPVSTFINDITKYRDSNIVCYCTAGARAGVFIAKTLAGEKNSAGQPIKVSNLKGGILNWALDKYQLVKKDNTPATAIHCFKKPLMTFVAKDYEAFIDSL